MKRLNFNLLILLVLLTSIGSINKYHIPVSESDKNFISVAKLFGQGPVVPEKELFVLQPEHKEYRLYGCTVRSDAPNTLSFKFRNPGRNVVVLKANAPLIITDQSGLTARLRPGWDGTLGYSLYALDVESSAIGSGRERIAESPVPAGGIQSAAVFDSRISRFPDSPVAFHLWQREWREKLANRLMNGGLPNRVPLAAEVVATEEYPAFTLRRVRYKSQQDRSNTLLLALPKKVSGPVPLLVLYMVTSRPGVRRTSERLHQVIPTIFARTSLSAVGPSCSQQL